LAPRVKTDRDGLPGSRMRLTERQAAAANGDPRTHTTPGLSHSTRIHDTTPRVLQSTRIIAIVTAAVSGVATIAFFLLPQLRLSGQWPAVRLALETSGSLIAVVATFLVYGRLLRRTYLNELLLASALAVLAVSNLFYVTLPTVAGWAPDDLTVWAAPFARGLGALLFTLAAFIPRRRLRRSGPVLALAGLSMITALGLATIFIHAFSERWDTKFAVTITLHSAFQAHPALSAFELLVALIYGLAAIGFLGRSQRFGDEFLGWLAVAAVLAVASHVNYSLFPVSSQSVLYTGDVFRFAFYVALLVGCMREIRSYWSALSEAAVLEERRRIAHDLHDGLAQELAYISRNLDLITVDANRETMGRVRLAVERAQLESRRAIHALAPSMNQAVEVSLAEAAVEIAERYRIQLELDIAPGIQLSPTRAEALVRIAAEAITNAARHSGAGQVALHLERDGSLVRLQIADRGRGFDTSVPGTGFGLIAMRERARSVGGELRICSAPGRGSEVEVSI
jgi:signal transduction histidine kinase